MSLTELEAGVIAHAYERRLAEAEVGQEIWLETEPGLLPTAHTLAEQGWLERRTRPELAWRLTDEGLTALRLSAMRRDDPADLN